MSATYAANMSVTGTLTTNNFLIGGTLSATTLSTSNGGGSYGSVQLTSTPSNKIISYHNVGLGTTTPSYALDMTTDLARKLTTVTWATGSDRALKNDIVDADLDRCVDIVSQLDLKYFQWNIPTDDTYSLGWIAQDVERIFPKAVRTSSAHGISDFKDLNSDQLVKVMWGALKKLRADLKAKQTP